MKGRIPGRDESPLEPVVRHYGLDLSGSILELGPGNGQLEPLVKAAGGMYVGVDKDPNAGVILLDYEQHPYWLPPGGWDGIFCRNSISAKWDILAELVGEIAVRVKPDGWAWISLWTGDSDAATIDEAMMEFEFYGFTYRPEYRGTNQALMTLRVD